MILLKKCALKVFHALICKTLITQINKPKKKKKKEENSLQPTNMQQSAQKLQKLIFKLHLQKKEHTYQKCQRKPTHKGCVCS